SPYIARNFAATGGVTHVHGVLQVELIGQFGEIVGVGVHIVAGPGLTRATMAPAVMSDTSISVGRQKEHLIFKGIRRERPAMAEYDGLSAAPVLVVNLRAVFGGNCAHRMFSFA